MGKDEGKEKVDPKVDPVDPKAGAPIPEDLKRKLDETVKIQLQLDDNGTVKMADEMNALIGLAVKGLLSDIKDSDVRAKVGKLVEGRGLSDAKKIIETFGELAPKQAAVGGVPVPSTDGVAQPFSCVAFSKARKK